MSQSYIPTYTIYTSQTIQCVKFCPYLVKHFILSSIVSILCTWFAKNELITIHRTAFKLNSIWGLVNHVWIINHSDYWSSD